MSVLPERTQAEITASRKLHTGSAVIARIVFANRFLAGGSQIACRTFAFPAILENLRAIVSFADIVLHVMLSEQLLLASSAIPTGIRQAC